MKSKPKRHFLPPKMKKKKKEENDERAPKISSSARLSKNTVSKKSLTAAFSSISEDPPSADSTTVSVISEIDFVDRDDDVIAESLMTLPDPSLAASTETLSTLDISPSSGSTISSHASWSVAKCENDGSKFNSMGAEVIASFLKEARTQVINSAGVDAKSKKLLDALVEVVIENFQAVPEERDQIAELLSGKAKILVVCSFLLILAMAMFLVFSSGARSTFRGPLPT